MHREIAQDDMYFLQVPICAETRYLSDENDFKLLKLFPRSQKFPKNVIESAYSEFKQVNETELLFVDTKRELAIGRRWRRIISKWLCYEIDKNDLMQNS